MLANELCHKIAIGSVQFGCDYGISNKEGQTSEKEVAEILIEAQSWGINVIDTANSYGNSETVLGKNNLEKFQIVSKFATYDTAIDFERAFRHSLDLLNVESLYGYLAHSSEILLKYPESWDMLQAFKSQGLVKKIGYSLYLPSELECLMDKGMLPDILQVPYSVVDRRFESYFLRLHEAGVEIHTRSSFLQGALLMPPEELSDFFVDIKPWLYKFHSLVGEEYRPAFLLRFCLSHPLIDRVVMGINTKAQLISNCRAINQVRTDIGDLSFDVTTLPERILLPYMW